MAESWQLALEAPQRTRHTRQAHPVSALAHCLERLVARGAPTSDAEQTVGQVNAFCGVTADAVHILEPCKNDTLDLLDVNQWPQTVAEQYRWKWP